MVGPIDVEVIEQRLHVGQFVVVALILHQRMAAAPKLLCIDAESRENDFVLHVIGRERLIVVVDDRDDILRSGHGRRGYARDARKSKVACGADNPLTGSRATGYTSHR